MELTAGAASGRVYRVAFITLAACLAVCVAINVVLISGPRMVDRLWPVTPASFDLQPGVVQLGETGLGEVREARVTFRNRSKRTVHLLDPDPDCGCIDARLSPRTVPPGGAASLEFRVRTPASPGTVSREVGVHAEELPGHVWKVRVLGRATAQVWSEPAAVRAELKPGERFETTIFIRHAEGVVVKGVVSDHPAIRVNPEPPGEGGRRVAVTIDPVSPNGGGAIRVLGEGAGGRLIDVPVTWVPRPELRCLPRALTVANAGRRGESVTSKVLVLIGDRRSESDLVVKELVPWVRVLGRDRGKSLVILRVGIDVAAMPASVNQKVLELGLKGGATPDYFSVVSTP